MPKKSEASAIVIGGGPAGLFLASRLAALGPAQRSAGGILLLEKMKSPGRKLLATGSGQCNITHAGPIEDFLGHYGNGGRFLKKALHAFSNEDLASWLGDRGIELETEEGGKMFPVSRRASDILRVLLQECANLGVEPRTRSRVVSVRREEELFVVETEGPEGDAASLRSPLVAIASGGCSYPATGSSGEGYALARSLGHRIVRPTPALAPVILRDRSLCALAGLSFAALPLTHRRGGKALGRRRGDVLITHVGLSGPGILDLSRALQSGDILELDFSGLGPEAFRAVLAARVSASPRARARTVLAEAGLPRSLAEHLCGLAGLGAEDHCSELRREARETLARLAASFPAEIAAIGGFEIAMATAGGVSLAELDSSTMESRLEKGLFFAGEVLDYDGDTGGYNLQAAFSTADAAARSMAASARSPVSFLP